MNNFIKKEIENGNIYNYKDPRAYKGLNEYYISDDKANYYIERHKNSTKEFEIGDIVFIKSFKYNNNNIGKNHLFVIVDKNNKLIPIEYFGMILSSNLEKKKYKTNLLIKKNDIEFYIGKVSKEAINKYNKLHKELRELIYE